MKPVSDDVLDRLLTRLPSHLLARDEEAGGLLRTLLGAVAAELDLLERDIDALYDSWFVETCAEWVLPYLADLVGLEDLPPDFGPNTSRRAYVANTVAYRRRKGTVAVLEQVARDVSGWQARAVEYYRLLATTTHVNHVRTDRPATACLRDALDLTALDHAGAQSFARGLDPLAHTAEVRRISSRRGRYGIPRVGVFLYPLHVYDVEWSTAQPSGTGFSVDPLGRTVPLFAPPRADEDIEHLSDEADLSVPLRPRRLLALLRAARRGDLEPESLPVGVRIDPGGIVLSPSRVRACGLEDLDPDTPTGEWQAMIDPVSGRLTCYDGSAVATPTAVWVRYAYGGMAEVGAGTYDRTDAHEVAIASDRYRRDPESDDAQIAVRAGATAPSTDVPSVADALSAAAAHWAALGGGATYFISIRDSASYSGALDVEIPAKTRLVIVGADWPVRVLRNGDVRAPQPGVYSPGGVRPHLAGPLRVTGGAGSSLILDGVVLGGELVVLAGDLGSLTVTQCTLASAIRVQSGSPGTNGGLRMRLGRSVVADVNLGAPVPELAVADSVVTGAVAGASVHAAFEASTVFGAVTVRSLDGTSCVFDSTVTVEHRQLGCLRFSYAAAGSRPPRRFRCAPDDVAPVFVSRESGSPAFAALAAGCPAAIRAGGEHGAEMGVHYHLRRTARVAAAQRAVADYVPVQIEFGIFGS
ncbi:phage tail protein [Mycolicibacterium celeriflavum]|uniref:phage tail protein n=1 Tax=Mycolicibacterium celeriflavum TaxID=1249101 RepID=UPI003CF75D77